MTGTTIAQAIPIAISPLLTRIYTPEEFGVFALFMAIVSIIGSVINGRYELAIMLPKTDEDAINILALGFLINLFISTLLLSCILIFHSSIVALLGNPEISPWLYLIPLSVFLVGCFNLLNYFNNRKRHYKDLAKANVYKSLVSAAVQITLGLAKAGVFGLLSGQILSQAVSNTKLFFNIKNLSLFHHVQKRRIISLAKRYNNHPIYLLPTTLFDTFSLKVPLFGINHFLSVSLLGQYALTERMLAIPSGLVGKSIGQVFYKEFTLLITDQDYLAAKRLIFTVWKRLFVIGIVPVVIIVLFGDAMFGFIFGESWRAAGEIAQVMIIMYFVLFISSPTSSAYNVLEMQKLGLLFGVAVLFYRIIIFMYFIKYGLIKALLIYAVIEIIQVFIYNYLLLRRLNHDIYR